MRSDVFVYISGPMTPRDVHTIWDNVAAGLRAFWTLLQHGIPAFCPHLNGAFPFAWTALPHSEWVEYDCAVIDRCTHVVMLPRWEASAGARLERAHAERLGIPVLIGVDALLETLQQREVA